MKDKKGILKALGPGLLFAAVSVGVSHLVQSTRAGAEFGLSLIPVILLALLLKYPLFEFGQRYAAATGNSLLEGYRRQGKWSLIMYLLLTLGSMFTVLAAITAVCSGLAMQLTGWEPGGDHAVNIWSAILIIIGGLILIIGRYPLLDLIIKIIMTVLGISTIAAMVAVLPKMAGMQLFGHVSIANIGAIVALVGWMPTGLDVSVWQSFWVLARQKQTGHKPSLKQTLFDFNFGYIGTAILAVMFCMLGTAVMFGSNQEFQPSAGAFAKQIIELYTESLGDWSRPIIVIAAFTTIFSTLLTVLDGFPRALQLVARRFRSPEDPKEVMERSGNTWDYWIWVAAISIGAYIIIFFYLKDHLGKLVDLATVLSFITGPFLGFLTYRAIMAPWVPDEFKPKMWMRVLAICGIGFLTAFMVYFIVMKIVEFIAAKGAG